MVKIKIYLKRDWFFMKKLLANCRGRVNRIVNERRKEESVSKLVL